VVEQDPHDANYVPCKKSRAAQIMKDLNSRPSASRRFPCPRPFISTASACPPATQTFTSLINWSSFPLSTTPTIASRSHTHRLFPGREVVGIACRDLVLGLGTLHCMTQQRQPALDSGFALAATLSVLCVSSP